jgi:hypothetical protein
LLQRNRNDLNVLSRITGVVTLHSPHQGSEVADVATDVHIAITALRSDPNNAGLQPVFDFLDAHVMNPCIPELSPSSAFLTNLRAGETTPLPVAIPIHTFGGTNPRLISVFLSIFDWMSAVPQWHLPPFHWRTNQVDMLNFMDGTPISLICPEEGLGGDVLVTDTRSHLPNEASHRSHAVNHANALCDASIQSDVCSVLATMGSNAAYITQSILPSMTPGSTQPVSITMTNTGTSTWISGVNCPFRLGTQNPQDNSTWGINRKDVPYSVAPGATVTFSFSITAPSTPGIYHFQWRMVQENIEWFGATTPDVQVFVGQPAVSGLTISPVSLASGSSMTVTVTLSSAAPAGGFQVNLASSKPNVVPAPSVVTVPAGATTVSTPIRAASVPVPTSVTLTATAGPSAANASVMVSPSAAYPYGTAMAVGVGGSLI